MARNGSGTYTLPAGNPVVTGTTISSTWANNTLSDIGTALTQSLAYDGQTTPVANLPMGGFKHTGTAVATSLTDYCRADQAQNSAFQLLSGVAGTNAITGSASITPSAYAAPQTFRFVAAGTNTGAVTINVSSLGAKSIKKRQSGGKVELVANDIVSGIEYSITYDGTDFLLNEQRPYSHGADIASASTINLDTATGDCVDVTGSVTINAITLAEGEERTVRFTGTPTITNGASLVCIGGSNITTAAGDYAVFRGYASGVVRMVSYTKLDGTPLVPTSIPVRQTVLSGPVDSSGFPSFGGSTGSTTVTASGTLTLTCALGASDYVGQITNPSWTGLSTNGTMHLYCDITSAGVVTTGSTTLAPVYQWGGTYSTTNGQNTFNIQEMTMKVGNGSSATQVFRVFVGRVSVSGGVVASITWFALMGRYDSGWTNTLPGTSTLISKSHNIGTPGAVTAFLIKCLTSEYGYSVGNIVSQLSGNNGTTSWPLTVATDTVLAQLTTGSSEAVGGTNLSTGGRASFTAANWAYAVTATRGW